MDRPKDSLAGAKATRSNSKAGVTPVLILCDNSGSMKHYVSIVNQCIISLINDLKQNSIHFPITHHLSTRIHQDHQYFQI